MQDSSPRGVPVHEVYSHIASCRYDACLPPAADERPAPQIQSDPEPSRTGGSTGGSTGGRGYRRNGVPYLVFLDVRASNVFAIARVRMGLLPARRRLALPRRVKYRYRPEEHRSSIQLQGHIKGLRGKAWQRTEIIRCDEN